MSPTLATKSLYKIHAQNRSTRRPGPKTRPQVPLVCMCMFPPLFPLTSGDHLSNSFADADSALQCIATHSSLSSATTIIKQTCCITRTSLQSLFLPQIHVFQPLWSCLGGASLFFQGRTCRQPGNGLMAHRSLDLVAWSSESSGHQKTFSPLPFLDLQDSRS